MGISLVHLFVTATSGRNVARLNQNIIHHTAPPPRPQTHPHRYIFPGELELISACKRCSNSLSQTCQGPALPWLPRGDSLPSHTCMGERRQAILGCTQLSFYFSVSVCLTVVVVVAGVAFIKESASWWLKASVLSDWHNTDEINESSHLLYTRARSQRPWRSPCIEHRVQRQSNMSAHRLKGELIS